MPLDAQNVDDLHGLNNGHVRCVISRPCRICILCVPRTSSGVLKVRPGNIGDEGHQEQGEM